MRIKEGSESLQATTAVVRKTKSQRYLVDHNKNRIEFADCRWYLDPVSLDFFPSATTILDCYPKDAHFYEWLKEVGDKADAIRDAAGDKGSTVHKLTEDYDNGLEVSYLTPSDAPKYSIIEWAMLERYVQFVKNHKPEFIDIEDDYVSREMGYGGTWDRKFMLPQLFEGKAILDIKTSNYVHDSFWVQGAAYIKLHNEKFPEDQINKFYVLWLNSKTRTFGKEGEIKGPGWTLLAPPEPMSVYMEDWEATKHLWYRKNKKTKPRNLVYSIKHNPFV